MKKQSLITKLKILLANICWKIFLWANNYTKEQYWEDIYFQEKRNLHKSEIGRRVGNSTRQVDICIQEFFKKGKCEIIDHYGNTNANIALYNRVLKRIKSEHPFVTIKEYRNSFIITNKNF